MKMNFSRVMALMAMRFGDRPALVNVERNRRYSYRELHMVTNRIANMLRDRLKLTRGDKYLLILENDNVSLMHFVSSRKQEGTVVFSNYRDSIEEHGWQVELAKPKAVFIETINLDRYYDMLRGQGCEIVVMDPPPAQREGVHDFWSLVDAASDAELDVEHDVHDHLAMLRFTGGTTGRGKCAMYSIDNCLGTRDGVLIHPDCDMGDHARVLHFAPLSHASMILYFASVFTGGTNYTQNLPDLAQWADVVEAERITHSFLVPTLLYRLLDMQAEMPRDFSSLTTIVYGAAPISPTRLNDLVNAFGPIFLQGYAATEVAMFVSVLDQRSHNSASDAAIRRLSSAGQVAPGVELFAADDEGNPLPFGETGEIMIRCRSVIKGYYENPEGTAAEFVNGAWKSGDLGYVDEEGYVFIVDRKKDMIISGGFNIYAVEVEAALGTHPAVQMSVVVGVPHPDWGEAVLAEVVLRPGAAATPEDLIAHVKTHLGSYKAPKTVHIVGQLPLSSVGKVLRRVVKDKYWHHTDRKVG
jgi:fatty-acyl-CoA synthase